MSALDRDVRRKKWWVRHKRAKAPGKEVGSVPQVGSMRGFRRISVTAASCGADNVGVEDTLAPSESSSSPEQDQTEEKAVTKNPSPRKKQGRRYILFVGLQNADTCGLDISKYCSLVLGNLPYSATSEDVSSHFMQRGVPVEEVRLLTKKGLESSRGCCFLELGDSKTQQNALKFNNTVLKGRKINVEVTCGGGGNGEKRKEKVKQRNGKLAKTRKHKLATGKRRIG